MIPSNDPHGEQSLRHDTVEELNALLSRLCDQVTTLDDGRRLNQILEASLAARRHYLKQIAIHSALVTTAGSFARPEFGSGRCEIDQTVIENRGGQPAAINVVRDTSPSYEPDKSFIRSVSSWSSLAVALCFIGLVVLWSFYGGRHQDQPITFTAERDRNRIADAPDAQQLIAEVTYVSPTARWQHPNASYALASRIRIGHSLVLEQGQVELTYVTGTKLLLTGPSEFLVESAGGKLRRGELVARVPKAGHGFTIETPHGKVIDLGTEFGVVVDDFGVSQVSVFEGKVETLPIGISDAPPNKIELTSGRALQWTGKATIPMDAKGPRYFRRGEETLGDIHAASVTTASIEDNFRSGSLPTTTWKTIGAVQPTDHGLQLGGDVTSAPMPYLITRQEFDPSQGAIRVVCDVRFAGTPDVGEASFAILTRSAQEQSQSGSPWQEMVARCLRCSFRMDSDSGEGILEAGTKYEPDRELSNIFWGGFSRPQPGTLYRLVMHDDGLNVAFTVSLAENPSVRKTINCRSLFRGNHNFIALEGASAGTVVVERLQISQQRPSDAESDQLAESGSQRSLDSSAISPAVGRELEKLTPADSILLLQDDFNDGELNLTQWATLGDVVLLDGQVQLGLPNERQRIDTWNRRPYLLTKRQFDPADGVLTIVGKITFADNFLHGYGGSFAVMTRADDSHGNGPGWENSILRRGVRANFWPAALGFEHSLEIHEKPAPNTISLLAAEGFQINPLSRSYLFRITDDGRAATLTFIDAENPSVQKTISHSDAIDTLSSGHIAFESCWGSPTLLDDIQIFRRRSRSQDRTPSDE